MGENKQELITTCPLCLGYVSQKIQFSSETKRYYYCSNCSLRFLEPAFLPTEAQEKEQYLLHNNDVFDPNYQKFVEPLFSEICKHTKPGSSGLDFGAGTGPVLTKMLKKEGYEITLYDPFFWPEKKALEATYDFIFASEVIEHFHSPSTEFNCLRKILKPEGLLAIMTLMYSDSIDFENWHYRRDPTHVCFYSEATFQWIKDHFNFSTVTVKKPRIVLFKA